MFRPSSFLLQHTYTVHRGVIEQLLAPQFSILWRHEFGASNDDMKLVPIIVKAIETIRTAYEPFAQMAESHEVTDTLVTKVLLGTFGCLPACDKYFTAGFKSEGFKYSSLNRIFIERVFGFCRDNLQNLRQEQKRIKSKSSGGMHYPLMKLVDMCFWEIGYENRRG
jgi:hypothetical protein